MMAMWLPILSASSRSWLTKMMVLFSCRCSSSSSSCSLVRISGIERREGLVHQQDRRLGGEGARQPDALLHAAGELVRIFLRPWREADQLELLCDPRLALGLGHAGELQAEADILGHGAPGQQRELLEHHGDARDADAGARSRGRSSRRRPCLPSSLTRTSPRAGLLRPLTARISVDLPEPERPISTVISPSLDLQRGSATPRIAPVSFRISERVAPLSSSAERLRPARLPNMMSTFWKETARASCALACFPDPADAVEDDGEHHDGEAGLDAHRDVDRVEARTTGLPRPLAPISAAMTTMERQSMMHWVRPAMMVGQAAGSSTFQSSCRLVAPKASPASISCFGTEVMPRWVRRIGRRNGEDDRGDEAGRETQPEQHQRRDEIDEGRQRLHQIEDGAEQLEEPFAMRGGDADRHADPHRHGGRADDQRQRLDRLLPEALVDDVEEADRDARAS